MTPSAAPKPPKPPIPKLELVPEVEAIPEDESDREPDSNPPPIAVRRGERMRRLAIGVAATVVGVLALTLAFRPWRWIGGDAHVAPTAHASIAATFAKRAKPAAPPPKVTVVAAQKKIAAPAKKAQPAATPPKPVAKRPTKNT